LDKYVLGQLKNTGAAESVGTAVGLGFGVQAGRFLLVNIGQEVELFEGKWSCSGGEQMSVIKKTENSSTVFLPGRKMKKVVMALTVNFPPSLTKLERSLICAENMTEPIVSIETKNMRNFRSIIKIKGKQRQRKECRPYFMPRISW